MTPRPLFLLLALALVPRTAAADGDPNKAKVKALYESATKHYNLSEYQQALDEYKEAYRIKDDAAFLFNIAQCNRQLNDPASAAKSYRAFLRESPGAKNRAAVEKLIDDMDKAVQEQRKSQPPLGTEPPEKSPDTTTTGETSPPPPATTGTTDKGPPGERPPFYKDAVGDVLVIAGVLILGAGVGLIVGASSFDSQANTAGVDLRTRSSAWDTAGTLSSASYAAFGVGAVLVVAGVIKWLTRPKVAAETSKVSWNSAGLSVKF